ncbi:MAG: threonine synthase [Coriobacteriales bacterium]|jgi:threonine synthase|nr:threonine synthase [Coriobacteriales bacterium]
MLQLPDYTNTFLDTRGAVSGLSFSEVILEGIAPGGGLFVPSEIPHLEADALAALTTLPYPQLAAWVYGLFGVDLPQAQVAELMQRAYGDAFDDAAIAPLHTVAPKTHVLELWHGPTSAFKDMALQCLPLFFSAAIERWREETDYLILVATSGDTGKAALEGFADRPHVNIIVFYPDGGVSDIQRLQMVSQRGANVGVFGLRGSFDDCQTAVKQVFANTAFNARLADQYGLKLSSANSINWGRLLPQIVYYFSAYLQLVSTGEIAAGESIDVCVPTGNFGNILAAWYARAVGVPIERLLCASNDNRVLADFINSGTYDISERDFVLTPSPSMDILVSSNLERQLFELCQRDATRIRAWMNDLREQRHFRVDRQTFAALRECFAADWVGADESLQTIREVFERYGYLLDPHSAVGWKVAERLRCANPVVVVSTAHWAKFAADVYRALNGIAAGAALPKDIAALGGLGITTHLAENYPQAGPVPSGLANLAHAPERFNEVVEGSADAVQRSIKEWLARGGCIAQGARPVTQ